MFRTNSMHLDRQLPTPIHYNEKTKDDQVYKCLGRKRNFQPCHPQQMPHGPQRCCDTVFHLSRIGYVRPESNCENIPAHPRCKLLHASKPRLVTLIPCLSCTDVCSVSCTCQRATTRLKTAESCVQTVYINSLICVMHRYCFLHIGSLARLYHQTPGIVDPGILGIVEYACDSGTL